MNTNRGTLGQLQAQLMKHQEPKKGDRFVVKPNIQDFANKVGEFVDSGVQYGWKVYQIRFPDGLTVSFAPDEVRRVRTFAKRH